MKSSRANKIISGILLTPALLILLSLLIILPSTALAQLESFVHSIQGPSTTLYYSWNNLTVKSLYSPWSIITLLFCIYKITPAYNLILKQVIYDIRQTWLSFNTNNDSRYTSQETMPCTYHQETVKKHQQLPHKQSNRKKQPQLHLVNNFKKEVEEEGKEGQQQEEERIVEIKQNITIAAIASITKHEDNTDPVEWIVVTEKSSKKKKRTKTKRNNNMQVPTLVNSDSQTKNKTSKPIKNISSNNNTSHVNGINTTMIHTTTSITSATGTSTGNNTPKKKIENKTNNNNIKTTNTGIIPITFAATVTATTSTSTTTVNTTAGTTATSNYSVKMNNNSDDNNNKKKNDWQIETSSFQDNDKQEIVYSVSNSSEDENQPDIPFLSDNESSGSESPCSTHTSLPPPLQDELSSNNYYSPFSTGFDFGVATTVPASHIYDDGNSQEDIWNPTRHHQWESGFLRPLYYTHQNHHHHHQASLLHLLNQPDKVETTITSESFRYFDDMVMSNTLYSSPPLQKSRVPRDWDSVLSASYHEIK